MADSLSIKEEQARVWLDKVRHEEEVVRRLLNDLSEECMSTPDEEDDIFRNIVQATQTAQNFWNRMCDGFDATCDKIGTVISNLGQAVETLVNGVKDFAGKIGR